MYNDQQQASNYPTNNVPQPYNQGYPQTPQNAAMAPPAPPISQPLSSQAVPSQPQLMPMPMPQPVNEAEMDKAWVDRAVVVLDKTREDPFLQSHEIAKLKAQYMQTRFEKEIKIAQEQK